MTMVVKIGGSAGVDAAKILDEIALCIEAGQHMVLLHGGSDLTNMLSQRLDHPVRMITSPGGMISRYTDSETLRIYAMAVAGQINTELVALLQQRGVNALGLAGVDGRLLLARRKAVVRSVTPEGRVLLLRDDYTGQIEHVNEVLLMHLLDAGYTPVIAPLALSQDGERLNVDGDRAAAAVAAALHAEALVIMTNVPGLLADPEDQTAAVIIELVQGEGGVHVASEQYVHGLARLCRERGALLIVDEVQTGFGRTGRLFACNHYDLQPDMLCLAKSLAGGILMGAICLGSRVTESGRISRGVHGSTFGGNPLACAAALATLDILEREALAERAAVLGDHALERLRTWHTPLIRAVRGRGLLIGIELSLRVQPYLEALLERGVLALQAGSNVIRLLPPLVITEEQLEQVLDVLEELLVEQAESVNYPGM